MICPVSVKFSARKILAAALASAIMTSCNGSEGGGSPPTDPPAPVTPPATGQDSNGASPDSPPQIDAGIRITTAPSRVTSGRPFELEIEVRNYGTEKIRVANVEGRISIQHAMGAGNVALGTDVVRNIEPGKWKFLTLDSEFNYDASGTGEFLVVLNPVLFEDPNPSNNRDTQSVVVD